MKIFSWILCFFISLSMMAESSISLLNQIGQRLDRIDNELVKKLLEERIQKAWTKPSEEAKVAALQAILSELSKEKKTLDNNLDADVGAEVELCNYLIQQACILEALDGAGVKIVRDDLTGNLNDHGLSVNGKRLLRRLVQLCQEAEKSYKNVSYVEVDGSDAQAELLTENISTGVGISLAMGDVTPLIAAAVKIGRGYNNINKAKSRQLELLIQAHKGRINNFLFNVNSHKNDLIAEKNVNKKLIITPDWYREFLQVLTLEDTQEKLKKLTELTESHPAFVTSRLYLAQLYFDIGSLAKAKGNVQKILSAPSHLLHKDGISGQAHSLLGQISELEGRYDDAMENYNAALKINSLNAFVYNWRAGLFLNLSQPEKALADLKKARIILPENGDISFNYFKASVLTSMKPELNLLKEAFKLGFNDVQKIFDWSTYERYVNQWPVKKVLQPSLLVKYDPGIFKDDAVIVNYGDFDLTKLKYSLKVKYLKKENWEVVTLAGELPMLKAGESFQLKDKFSMPKKSRCEFALSFTCDQLSESSLAKSYYNSFGNNENHFEWRFLRDKTEMALLGMNDKGKLLNSLIDIERAVTLSCHADPKSLAVLAAVHYKLKEFEKAVVFQKEALAVLTGEAAKEDLSIISQPYVETLKKYEGKLK
ncbi:MAG: hypothetical protein MK132_09550 [Lentisphaerales bacterium]|nr:hypothetical protein [Lentisphaerales bacterium]